MLVWAWFRKVQFYSLWLFMGKFNHYEIPDTVLHKEYQCWRNIKHCPDAWGPIVVLDLDLPTSSLGVLVKLRRKKKTEPDEQDHQELRVHVCARAAGLRTGLWVCAWWFVTGATMKFPRKLYLALVPLLELFLLLFRKELLLLFFPNTGEICPLDSRLWTKGRGNIILAISYLQL